MSGTRQYALVGHPIEHSPSPAMHDAAFAALGLDARYVLRPTTLDEVPRLLQELTSGRWAGVNVTTPLKIELARHVDGDATARRAGAVNTVWREGGRLVGTLTDVDGVREPLRAAGFAGPGTALVLGAGGAARAAAVALDELGATVHVAARDPARAAELLTTVAPARPGRALKLKREALREVMRAADVVVQATPLGRGGEELALPWEEARRGVVAFEMLYRPRETPFLCAARGAGARLVYGWEMLLAQGARSFELWTGEPAPREVMQRALLEALGKDR